jgi:alpha-2-macroglobulin
MFRRQRLLYLLVSSFLLASIVLSSCSLFRRDEALTETPTAVDTTPEPSPTSRPAGPTPTPLPPIPPQVIDRQPARGEELPVDAPLLIRFDQPMDQQSVQKAFSIEPPVVGRFEWADDRTVLFRPQGELERQADYNVQIGPAAASALGLPVEQPYTLRFQTVGFLQVSQTLPADETPDVDVDSTITVLFNRPVVPLVHSSQQRDLPQPLTFAPAITGAGEWLNTSIYVYRPAAPLAAGTQYRVTVAAGLQDLTGGVLAEDTTWSFTTQAPRVTFFSPPEAETNVALTGPITVTFNQPMDLASVEAAFYIESEDGGVPPGYFRWNEDLTTFTWQPAYRLALESRYDWSLSADARAAAGEARLQNPVAASFWTVKYPQLLFTRPGDGDPSADPYGGLDLYFASPMDLKTIMPNLAVIPEPTRVYTWWDPWENRFYVGFEKQPSTRYTVTLGADMADPYGNTLAEGKVVNFTTGPLEPMAYLNTPGRIGTYNVYTRTVVYAIYRNVEQLDLTLARLTEQELVNLTASSNWRLWDDYQPRQDSVIRTWSVALEEVLNETLVWRIPLVDEVGDSLSAGIYYLQMTAPGLPGWSVSRHILVVTPVNLTVKAAAGEVLVWATDLLSGQPVANLAISVLDGDGDSMASGATDADGLLVARTGPADFDNPGVYAFAGRSGGDQFSVANTQWSNGIAPWDFSVPFEDYRFQRTKVYLYTDRPIYRPGQTVYFKGVVREPDEARYRLPDWTAVTIEAYDWEDTLIYRQTLPVTPLGTFAGQLQLDAEAKTGSYHFVVDTEELREWVFFQVAEYRKPEFQVEVTPAADQVVVGETIRAEVEASYFFGGAVDGAEVEWAVFADSYAFQWQGPGRYSFIDYEDWVGYRWDTGFTYGYGELIAQGTGTTDAGGRFTIDLPAELGDRTGAQLFTVEVTIIDINKQRVAGRAQVVVHPAARYAGLYTDRYVGLVNEGQNVNLIVVDLEQQPIPRAQVTLVALQREWYNVQVEEDGYTRWEWIVEETPVLTETVIVGSDGRATATFVPPEPGSYRLRVIARDEAGRENRASSFLWVSGDAFVSWRMENNDRIELIADRTSYRPGDVAEILIPSPFQGEVKALVTVERGHFFQQQVLTLQGNSEIYRLPITDDYAPTVYVSVILVKGIDETNRLSSFKMGVVRLDVSNEQQVLNVELVPQAELFAPGETVTYDLLVTDYQGRPVAAELSLALVDLSVLTLAPDQAPPIADAFYSQRGLGVETGLGLVLNVDRLNEEVAERAKGGGGGEGLAAIGIDVRSEFPDTAYWEAFVQTDAGGRARVDIPLPDNLTTWRLSAKAVTAQTLVGQASTDIVATKPLLVRPLTPRFFVTGDRARLGAVVHNNTERALEVDVSLAAQGVTIQDAAAQTVQVPSGGRVEVNWDVVVDDVQYVGLIFAATGGGLTDASKPTLATGPDGTIPVYRYSAPDIVGTAGQLVEEGARTEGIVLPPTVDPTRGALWVELAPSLAAALQDGLAYLEHFEYECTEQTVSRFLPNVLTYRALRDLGLDDPVLAARLQELVGQGLQRLSNQQHYDGGWGWWPTTKSDPTVTAWTLLGLDKAQEAGFAVDRQVSDDAAAYLRKQLQTPSRLATHSEANQQAFILYALAEYDPQGLTSRLEALYEEKDLLSHYGKAYLGLAYGILEGADSRRIDTLLADIAGQAILSATGAHWEEEEYDWWNWNTDTRSTAIILDLLARFDPANDLAPNVVRWLMVARTAGHWATTQETAWALIALADWMVATGELQADYQYQAAFNGQPLVEGRADRESIRETVKLQISVTDLLRDQVNRLSIGRSAGPGRLYYTAHLESYVPVADLEPIGRGVMVAREYTAADCDPDETTCQRISSIGVGDAIRVKLTIVAPHDRYYLIVEDPLPAGAEAVDQNLLTSSTLDQSEGLRPADFEYRWGYWGWWWFNQTQIRDDKVVLFAEYLPAGTYEYTYIMRASLAGDYQVMPTTAHEFYFPEVFGRSEGSIFVIEP